LAVVYKNIAHRKPATGRITEAQDLLQKHLNIRQKLALENSTAFGAQMDVGGSYITLAEMYRQFPKQFDDWFERATEL
jgi:hypothetical protein